MATVSREGFFDKINMTKTGLFDINFFRPETEVLKTRIVQIARGFHIPGFPIDGHIYHMAGNFRGVLIFVIFVVDLAVTKFSHPRKLMPTVICESMVMGMATNIMAARPTFPGINKQ